MASGGNDNQIIIYDIRMPAPLYKNSSHKAAVRALEFSKTKECVLYSGGGSEDQRLCRWDFREMKLLQSLDLKSQICSLKLFDDEMIVTAHGWPNNQIEIRRAPDLELVAVLKGHTQRVLHLAMNDAGDLLMSGAGDESLRFWELDRFGHDEGGLERGLTFSKGVINTRQFR